MDQSQEEMKFMGLLGIFSESFKTIVTWKKIFAQITFTLILPLTIIFLAHMEISHRMFSKIERDPYELFSGVVDVYGYYRNNGATSADWLNYLLFKGICITILTVFSLLSTAAIVYTIASIYTGRDFSYRKVMKVVPRVWKRLAVTFLCMFLAFFAYSLMAAFLFLIWKVALDGTVVTFFGFSAIMGVYVFGFLYLIIVWQVASVVSVLEKSYGLKAMIKGKDLLKGKRMVALMVFFLLYVLWVGVVCVYLLLVEFGEIRVFWKVMIGILCWVLLLMLFLLLMVTQTMLYLVCKSHHRETIDKLSLSTYLGAYLGESCRPAFIVGEEIQLGRPQPASSQV